MQFRAVFEFSMLWFNADAVLDAKRSLELQPNNANAFLRKGYVSVLVFNYIYYRLQTSGHAALNWIFISAALIWMKLSHEKTWNTNELMRYCDMYHLYAEHLSSKLQ